MDFLPTHLLTANGDLTSNGWMVATGAVAILLGILMMWRSSRHDLKGAVIESAWAVVRGRRSADHPTEIGRRLSEISAEPTHSGKAKRAARAVVAHFVSQLMGFLSTILMIAGGILIAAGVFWK